MAITFDPTNKRIILDRATVQTVYLYSRWKEWVRLSDNAKYPPAFSVVGGDPLGGGIYVASYFFLLNGWRIRPMEVNHTLILEGNISVAGGGIPVVQTLGNYNVSAQYTVPVQAQGIETGGSGGNVDVNSIANAVISLLTPQLTKIDNINITDGNVNANLRSIVNKPVKIWNGSNW